MSNSMSSLSVNGITCSMVSRQSGQVAVATSLPGLPGPFGLVSAHCRPHSRQNWSWPQGTRTAAVSRSKQMMHRSSSSICGFCIN